MWGCARLLEEGMRTMLLEAADADVRKGEGCNGHFLLLNLVFTNINEHFLGTPGGVATSNVCCPAPASLNSWNNGVWPRGQTFPVVRSLVWSQKW